MTLKVKSILALVLTVAMLLSCSAIADESAAIAPITEFPEPEAFTEILASLPNPFISWEGTQVTPDTWPARAEQLEQIIAYYMHGTMPSTEGITTSLAITKPQEGYGAKECEGLAEITVYKDGVAAPTTIKLAYLLPDPAVYPAPEDGYPVMLTNYSGWFPGTPPSVNNFYVLPASFGIAVLAVDVKSIDSGDNEQGSYKGADRAGVVNELFDTLSMMPDGSRTEYSAGNVDNRWLPPYISPENPGDPDAPSLMITQTWGLGRVLDALEADMAKPAGERLLNLSAAKSGNTGMSRLGKLALVAGAFEPRFAVVNPVSSGSGGVVIDRFTSIAVNEQQYLGLEPSMGGEYPINKYYYYVKIEEAVEGTYRATAVLPADALIDPAGRLDGGTTAASEYQTFNDFNDFISGIKVAEGELNPYAKDDAALLTTGVGHGDNIKPGYAVINFGIQTGEGIEQGWHQGTQNYCDVRWGYGCWFSPRFRQWPILEQFGNVDIIKRANRGEYGYLATVPFDQHYLIGMIAPRGLLIQDGYMSNNTSPEGTYFGYLAGREIYRFLGAENKIGLNMHLINHANPLREIYELGEFMLSVLNDQPLDEKFSYQPFPINDPRSLYDYAKLDWAAPGYDSLKTQVEAFIDAGSDSSATSVYVK